VGKPSPLVNVDSASVQNALREVGGAVRLVVIAKPKSRQEGIFTASDGRVMIQVAAPADGGRANHRLVELVAQILGCPKKDVELVRGQRARHKEVEITGLALSEVLRRLISGSQQS
jgi:uncharacterized protein (TIGR00251 family)